MRTVRGGVLMVGRLALAIVVCAVMLLGQHATAQVAGKAPVEVDPPATKVGILLPGEKKRSTFEVVNNGDKQLRLTEIKSSCPCITASTRTDLIEPGGRLEVVLDVEAGWNSHKAASKNISLFFEGYTASTNTSAVFAVSQGVRPNVTKIDLRKAVAGRVRLESIDGKTFSVLRVDDKEPNFPGGFDPAVHDPRKDYNVTYNFKGRGAETPLHLIIETDHPDARIIALPVFSEATDAVRMQWQIGPIRSLRRSIVVGEISSGQEIEFEMDMMCKINDFSLEATTQNHEKIWVDILSKKLNKSKTKWRVKARMTLMDESFRGLFDETVVLRAGGNLQTSIQVIGRAVDPAESEGAQGDG